MLTCHTGEDRFIVGDVISFACFSVNEKGNTCIGVLVDLEVLGWWSIIRCPAGGGILCRGARGLRRRRWFILTIHPNEQFQDLYSIENSEFNVGWMSDGIHPN
jgi:hypothetical protein